MNIREAKEEIVRSVRAYTARDEAGCFRIPSVRQRPVLLMGPPGIGKTAIMEQAAKECGVGLLAYTITHHTRQSAVGLPQLMNRSFEGRDYTVTEYTLSEIIGSVYAYMERTGYREGILFIDEINCVSETLAPTMLQFLQYKMFGNHRVPEGWVIAAAGNPPEFNRSVRELDMASLDRVRTIEVEADFSVWKDYAESAGVHPAILSYLQMKPESFYRVVQTREKREFVTARGWEDLSVLMKEYERQNMRVDRPFVEEFIRHSEVAADFAAYYQMYRTAVGSYRIPELAAGTLQTEEQNALKDLLARSSADMRCMFIRHLLAAVSERMTAYGKFRRYVERKREVLEQLISYMKDASDLVPQAPEEFLRRRTHALQVKKENLLLHPWEEALELQVDENLKELLYGEEGRGQEFLKEVMNCPKNAAAELTSSGLSQEEERLQRMKESLLEMMNRMTDLVLEIFGRDLELADWLHGLKNHGDFWYCGFTRPELDDFSERKASEEQLKREIAQMEGLYETDDRI